ncbi:GyrI-like domain-containing protein [Fictibacillus sp. S7]|uniref:GyrI-like domain-containing protein n=1 Tax=Fictibacillus sp. S7 TaxID=2212476 RepID=UPI0010107DA4|nr:hypothetical protein DMO16_13905 [Fictibacillus sp. S7]
MPEGLEILSIPATKWGVFEVHGAMPDSMQNAWKQISSEWFPSSHQKASLFSLSISISLKGVHKDLIHFLILLHNGNLLISGITYY